jgi:hypothetical protein
MTPLLEQAYRTASQLSDEEQDLLAAWLLAELGANEKFDQKIDQTAHKLIEMAEAAIEKNRAGRTMPMREKS